MRLVVFFTIILLSLACSGPKSEVLDPNGLYDLMYTKNSLQLIDVRTAQEFQSGHLREALLIDLFSSEYHRRIETLNKSQPIAVYCAVGQRSLRVFEELKEKGFEEVYHLKGGIELWKQEGKPIVY